MGKTVYVLDSLCGKRHCSIHSCQYSLTEMARDFSEFVHRNEIKQKQLWFANIFEMESKKHIAIMEISDEGDVIVSPAPEDSTLEPFIWHLTINQKIILAFFDFLAFWENLFHNIWKKILRAIGIDTSEDFDEDEWDNL